MIKYKKDLIVHNIHLIERVMAEKLSGKEFFQLIIRSESTYKLKNSVMKIYKYIWF